MGRTSWGIVVAAVGGLIAGTWAADAQSIDAVGLTPGAPTSAGLIAQVVPREGRGTALVVVDPQTKAIGVYHIAADTGAIELCSIRAIRWDLEMSEYNSSKPLPEEIRKGLARAR